MSGEDIAARARRCVGARFRAQGRDPRWGLDCVGLVAFALELKDVRTDYALRGGSMAALGCELERAGLRPVERPATGDVLVLRAGPAQLHLAIVTTHGIVHADAGLRRVVERPGPPPWPRRSAWRAMEEA